MRPRSDLPTLEWRMKSGGATHRITLSCVAVALWRDCDKRPNRLGRLIYEDRIAACPNSLTLGAQDRGNAGRRLNRSARLPRSDADTNQGFRGCRFRLDKEVSRCAKH